MKAYLKKTSALMLAFVMLFFAAHIVVFAEEGGTEQPAPVEAPVPVEAPAEEPAEEPAPVEAPVPVEALAEEPTKQPAPVEVPVSVEAPAEEPAEEPAPAEAPVEEPAEEPAPAEVPAAPFEQREQMGSTLITVTAPAGVVAPGICLMIAEANAEAFLQAVQAVCKAQEGDIVLHRMIRFSGAEIAGAAQIRVKDPRIAEMESQYPGAGITVSVYAYRAEAEKPADRAKQINAVVSGNVVSFSITDLTIYDVVIVVRLPAAEPTEEPVEEAPAEPTEEPVAEAPAEPTEEPVKEALAESTEEPVEEAPAEPTEEPVEEAPAEPTEEPVAETPAESTEEPVEEAPAEPTEEPVEEAPAEPTEEPVEETPAEPTEKPVEEAPAEPAEEPVAEAPAPEDTAAPADDPFDVVMSASFEGELCYGTTVTLTAAFSVEDPDAVIVWEYSPDGGRTIFTVEGEHSPTLVYTYSEENKDYSWRVTVYRTPAA